MPEQPTKSVDPLTENPIKADPVREPFRQATEEKLVKQFPGWNDRETAKVVIGRANGAMERAEAHMKTKSEAASGKPALEHPGPGGQGRLPPNTPTMDSSKVGQAKSQYCARVKRIEQAKDRIFEKIQTGQYKPRTLSPMQIRHADRVNKAASLKIERDFEKAARGDERNQFNRAARGR